MGLKSYLLSSAELFVRCTDGVITLALFRFSAYFIKNVLTLSLIYSREY